MKNMSKTLLSMALVIAMVLSIMPMSFAEGGEEAASDVTIKYSISEAMASYSGSGNSDGSLGAHFTYEKTNNFYANASMSKWVKPVVRAEYLLEVSKGYYVIFEINVPVKGTYKLRVNNSFHNNSGVLKAYISPATDPIANVITSENYVGKINCDKNGGGVHGVGDGNACTLVFSKPFLDVDGKDAEKYFETPGKYYIGMQAVQEDNTTGVHCRFADFYLVSGDGSGYALIGDMTITPDAVKAGESAKATATAYKSNDASAVTAFTYDSSNKAVATVDSEGNITTLKAGKTTITATAEGSVNSLSRELTVTSANASDVTVTYDFMKNAVMGGTTPHAELYTYETTNGFFRYVFDATKDTKFGWERKFVNNTLQLAENRYEIFEIDVPVAGDYDVKISYATDVLGDDMNVYLFKSNGEEQITHTAFTDERKIGVVDCYDETDTSVSVSPTLHTEPKNLGSYPFEKGKYYFAVQAIDSRSDASYRYAFISGLTLDGGNGDALMPCFNGNTTLEVDEKAKLSGFLSSTAAAATVAYESSNDCVTVATDGTITAVKPGKATVTMTASDSTVVDTAKTYSVEITVKDAKTDFVSIGIDADGKGVAPIGEAALGDEVTVTAVDRSSENMIFRGWVRGSKDNGRLVSTDETYKFTATTHTYLTAIYTEKVDGATNEYYHWNGQFLGNDEVTAEANLSPIVGYTFAKDWSLAKEENSIKSWIAVFTKNDDKYEVEAGNEGFSISKDDDNYDTEVKCTSDSAVYWYRDGKLVDYGKEYKFFIWDNTTVTTKTTGGHNGAKLMLDVEKDNTYMVEYDAGNATLLEVGILFGNADETPTVENCRAKMSSQRNIKEKDHGQFSATSDKYPVARGYLVYKDGDAYRVIYAD